MLLTLKVSGVSSANNIETDLLIIGGSESAVAAAVQAARMGQTRIVIVNDIDWFGGQFSAEAVGAIDEWTMYKGKRTDFPRSGLFLEVLHRTRAYNHAKYGLPHPGNAMTASETIEPAAAARIFEDLLETYKNQVRILRGYQPAEVETTANRVRGVTFEKTIDPKDRLTVRAKMTIDASDWGDVIRLSGAAYAAGPDVKARFGEENAPGGPLTAEDKNEMNPITYCLVVREAGKDATITRPPRFDERSFYGTTGLTTREFEQVGFPKGVWRSRGPAFIETSYPEGPYGGASNPYTHRRLVDRYHNNLPRGTEKILLSWPTQDYPLYNFPKHVADALEAAERGASAKNIVDMTPAQRRIVFEDAKQHSLGMYYHLQTTAHGKAKGYPQSFKYYELTDEFGTPDRMPFKPYVREGLRLEALYMLREEDIKQRTGSRGEGTYDPTWARRMVQDSVFGFQFNIDFHPTRRLFLNDDPAGPWMNVQTVNRNWSTHTDIAGFPFRSLVPVRTDGLLGANKNLGYSSIVSSAVRLHGQMMMIGQAAGAAASLCLNNRIQPRDIVRSLRRTRELQSTLLAPKHSGFGIALWSYFDVKPDDSFFTSANMLAVRQIMPGDAGGQDFMPWKVVTRRELARSLARAVVGTRTGRDYKYVAGNESPSFQDIPAFDSDRPYIESLARWGAIQSSGRFMPDEAADWFMLHDMLTKLNLKASPGLLGGASRNQGVKLPLVRYELVNHLWAAIKDLPEQFTDETDYLKPGHDADGDGTSDLEDALPFDGDNDNLPDLIDPVRG